MRTRIFLLATIIPSAMFAADPDAATVRRSVQKAIALLQPTSVAFVKKTGCISCHHNSLPQIAVAMARKRGFEVNEELAAQNSKANLAVFGPHRENLLQSINTVPASPSVSSYALVALAADDYRGDATTDAMAHDLAQKQQADGGWAGGDRRPPIGFSRVGPTALSLRALQIYLPEGRRAERERRVARARHWLAAQSPVAGEDRAFQLLGLAWSKADKDVIQKAVRLMLAAQRPDGGWSQLPTLDSDAYATGQALVALQTAGHPVNSAEYRRGVQYLLSTQKADGSWYIQSRAMGFQPYFESGFPHGHDQWISSAATSWASMALTSTLEPVRAAR